MVRLLLESALSVLTDLFPHPAARLLSTGGMKGVENMMKQLSGGAGGPGGLDMSQLQEMMQNMGGMPGMGGGARRGGRR